MNIKSSPRIIFYIALAIITANCGNQQPQLSLDATIEAREKATVTVLGIDEATQVDDEFAPTNSPSPITPSPIAHTIATTPLATCLMDIPPGLLGFGYVGEFDPPQPPTMDEALNQGAWNTARRLICDETFMIQHPQGDYNIWTGLLIEEDASAPDAIPHIIAKEGKNIGAIIEAYGEPSTISHFRMNSGEILDVYWFGPIFIMADQLDGKITGIGGWLSLLIE